MLFHCKSVRSIHYTMAPGLKMLLEMKCYDQIGSLKSAFASCRVFALKFPDEIALRSVFLKDCKAGVRTWDLLVFAYFLSTAVP